MSSPTKTQASPNEPLSDLIYYCCVCLNPLSSATSVDPKQPDFWLTSCGHIICTSDLFTDGVPKDTTTANHTCPFCQSNDVSLAAVTAGKTPTGLRDYFTPHGELLENITGALRFQNENLVRIATHYKEHAERLQGKLDSQKSVLLRVKDELVEARDLKREKPLLDAKIARLQQENEELRRNLPPGAQVPRAQQMPTPEEQLPMNHLDLAPNAVPLQQQHQQSPLKRKADSDGQDESRVRDFRRELNGRAGMPPPPVPMNRTAQNNIYSAQLDRNSPPGQQTPLQMNSPGAYNYNNSAHMFRREDMYDQPQFPREPNRQPLPQNYAEQPPPTPQRAFIQRPPETAGGSSFVNPPFRSPVPQSRINDHYALGKFSSPSVPRPPLYKMISPSAGPGGRLSLAPQTSSGGRPGQAPGEASPFFSRPNSVAGHLQSRPESRNIFAGEYFQRPDTSRAPSLAPSRGFDRSRGGGGGGLGDLLNGNNAYVDRPGLRRAVRRD